MTLNRGGCHKTTGWSPLRRKWLIRISESTERVEKERIRDVVIEAIAARGNYSTSRSLILFGGKQKLLRPVYLCLSPGECRRTEMSLRLRHKETGGTPRNLLLSQAA